MRRPNLGRLLTTEETARRLRVDPSTVRRWRRDGVGPRHLKMGSVYRYPANELEAWIAASMGRRVAS
ncbi:helix-turn-helix domain-containing protein [Jiangella muralis]|uniref:helix-turn-helix domain-containing protein n=1 Tax=Jiangella muralis TaxID=702383 RepID=UPI0009FA80B1|nr:helix-turn-helix domain-containing protein [Jiangella muralis]